MNPEPRERLPVPVRITELNVQNLGPLGNFSLKPGRLTCVYGRNERGKTYLVEFLVRSLFRNAKDWRLRSPRGSGRVTVEGLEDKPVFFTPSSPKKLEDHWGRPDTSLPPDFSRLLVVKGAEIELARAEGGVDRAVLKAFLSGADVLDRIQNRISKTVQSARIEAGRPIGNKSGEIKDHGLLEEQLKRLDALFGQIDKGYSGGRRALLEQRRARLAEDMQELLRAKRHQAHLLAASIREIETDRAGVDEEALSALRQGLHLHAQKKTELRRKAAAKSAAEERSRHFEWLRSARDEYRDLIGRKTASVKPLFLVLALVLTGISMACIVLEWTLPALLTLAAGVTLAYVHTRRLHAEAENALSAEELNGLRKEFQVRFRMPLAGVPQLEELIRRQETDFNEARLLDRQIAEDRRDLEILESGLASRAAALGSDASGPEAWAEAVKDAEARLRGLSAQKEERRVALARLAVDPSEYVPESPGQEWNEARFRALVRESESAETDLKELAQKLDQLKQKICEQTGDAITVDWPALIQSLQAKREQTSANFSELTAEIIGQVALMQVLETLRKTEDAKIEENLNGSEILSALGRMTGRYRGLRLEGDTLQVFDDRDVFALTDLSTGAQEQTLLALRIGFAARLLRKDRLFLILDDAFQYSDWERRRGMVDCVAGLAADGWQVLYFTMDDHLRDLFDERGKAFGKEYVRAVLE